MGSAFVHEHSYCRLDRLKFDRQSLLYIQRTAEEEEAVLRNLQPTEVEDLKFLRKELEARLPHSKWTAYPNTETKRAVSFSLKIHFLSIKVSRNRVESIESFSLPNKTIFPNIALKGQFSQISL